MVSSLPRPAPVAFVSMCLQVFECTVFTCLFILRLTEANPGSKPLLPSHYGFVSRVAHEEKGALVLCVLQVS